jgi:hypothetical protein
LNKKNVFFLLNIYLYKKKEKIMKIKKFTQYFNLNESSERTFPVTKDDYKKDLGNFLDGKEKKSKTSNCIMYEVENNKIVNYKLIPNADNVDALDDKAAEEYIFKAHMGHNVYYSWVPKIIEPGSDEFMDYLLKNGTKIVD